MPEVQNFLRDAWSELERRRIAEEKVRSELERKRIAEEKERKRAAAADSRRIIRRARAKWIFQIAAKCLLGLIIGAALGFAVAFVAAFVTAIVGAIVGASHASYNRVANIVFEIVWGVCTLIGAIGCVSGWRWRSTL